MDLHAARNVLLCLRWGIGDLVMELPLLEALRRSLPSARITAVGARPALDLLEVDPRVDTRVCVQDWGLRHWGDGGDAHIVRRIREWLAVQRFDAILDPSHAVIGLRDVLWRHGGALFDTGRSIENEALREGGGGAAALRRAAQRGWGVTVPPELAPRLALGADDRAFAAAFVREHAGGASPVAVSPVASSPLKRWPVARLAAIADGLVERLGARVLVVHGPQAACGAELIAGMRHGARAIPVGALPLRRTAALLAHCTGFVGNDTGLMHLAAAVGCKVVGLFGPTSADIYLPPGQAAAVAQTPCPHRNTQAFGPPGCLLSDRCLTGLRSCIDGIGLSAVEAALTQASLWPRAPVAQGS